MNQISKTAAAGIIIISSSVILSGCTLFPNKEAATSDPTPAPTASTTFPLFDEEIEATDSALPSPTPKTTTAATPKPTVKGTATTQTTVTQTVAANRYFDTSFDSWRITNYPGQTYEKELILYNKSDKPVMYAVRAADKPADSSPVSVNDSFEVTGKMLPLSQAVVKLKARSSEQKPNFSTTVTINFVSEANQILATKTVTVTAYSPTGDRITVDTDTATEKAGNQTADVTYKSLGSYPIRINNRNQRELNFEAKIISPEAAKVMEFSAKSGVIKSGNWWDTDIHFVKPDTKVDQVTIEFIFTAPGDDPYRSSKTLTLKFN
jgi:hypothetical protein